MNAFTLKLATKVASNCRVFTGQNNRARITGDWKRLLPSQFIVVLATFLILGTTSAFAGTTYTSTATGGDWATTTTWSGGVVPVSGGGNTVVITAGATVTLATAITYAGTLTINSGANLSLSSYTLGTVKVLNMVCGDLGSSITGSGALSINNAVNITNTGTGTNPASITCPVIMTVTPTTFTVAEGAGSTDLSISGIVSGSIALTKAGAGQMLLSGANSYTLATTVSVGTLIVGDASALGTNATGTSITSGAVLDLNGTNYTTTEALSVNGTGISSGGALINSSGTAASYSGAVTLGALSSIGGTGDITISGATVGNFALTKVGAGTLTLGTNTSTAAITISGGTFKLGSTSSLGTTGAGTTVSSPASLDLNGNTLSTAEALSINGAGVSNAGALLNSGAAASYSGAVTLASASSIGGTGDITLSGATAGNFGLTKVGAGTLTLGSNSSTAAITISEGTFKLGSTSSLGTIANGTTVSPGASLDLNGTTLSTAEALSISGAGVTSTGALKNSSGSLASYTGTVTMGSASTIGTTGNISLSALTGGGYDLTKVGVGSLSLAGTVALGALNISAGTLTSTSGTMSLTGNFTNDGTFTHNSGTVTLNGTTGTQTISGATSTTFNTLTLSGAATKNINKDAVVGNLTNGSLLEVAAGKKLEVSGTLTNNSTLTLKSDATNSTATVIDNANAGSGTFNTELYLSGHGGATPDRRFWYVSSPLTGSASTSFDLTSNKLWKYNESTHAYDVVPTATTLSKGVGYVARLGTDKTVTFSGTAMNTGDQAIAITKAADSNGKRGYNLVGNPYPSYVSMNEANVSENPDVETTLWFRSLMTGDAGMAFDTYNILSGAHLEGSGSGTITGDVAPMQSFWVRAINEGPSNVQFKQNKRSHVPAVHLRGAEVSAVQNVRLMITNGTTSDQTLIGFYPNASDSYDPYDSHKMSNENASIPEIYTYAGADEVAINGLAPLTDSKELVLGFRTGTAGTFTLKATELANLEEGTKVILKDKLLNVVQNLQDAPEYTFSSDVTTTNNRFTILISKVATTVDVLSTEPAFTAFSAGDGTLNVQLNNLDVNGSKINVYDVSGQLLLSKQASANITSIDTNLPQGLYLVEVSRAGYVGVKKIVVNK
jgi:autotransporter-associated beta strand protein